MQVESSGTQTAVIGTEQTLASPSTANIRVLVVDANNLASGEVLNLRFYGPVLSGGTSRLIRVSTFTGALLEPIAESPPFVMPQGGSITLQQTSGTARSFPWAIVTLS